MLTGKHRMVLIYCHILILLYTSFHAVAVVYRGPMRCEIGNGYIQWTAGDNMCYKFFETDSSFSAASTTCSDLGGWITSVKNKTQEDFIISHLMSFQNGNVEIWIGLYRDGNDNWLWQEDNSTKGDHVDEETNAQVCFAGMQKNGGAQSRFSYKNCNSQFTSDVVCVVYPSCSYEDSSAACAGAFNYSSTTQMTTTLQVATTPAATTLHLPPIIPQSSTSTQDTEAEESTTTQLTTIPEITTDMITTVQSSTTQEITTTTEMATATQETTKPQLTTTRHDTIATDKTLAVQLSSSSQTTKRDTALSEAQIRERRQRLMVSTTSSVGAIVLAAAVASILYSIFKRRPPDVSDLELIDDIKASREQCENQESSDCNQAGDRRETVTPSNINPEIETDRSQVISAKPPRKIRLLPSMMLKNTSKLKAASAFNQRADSLTPTEGNDIPMTNFDPHFDPGSEFTAANNFKFRLAVTKVVAVKSFKPRIALLPR